MQICSFPKEHGLKNWQQTRYTICVWRRLGVHHKRLGVVKGSGAAPRRDASKTLAGAPGRAGRMDAGVGEEDEDKAGPPERGGSSAGAARAEQWSWSGRSAGTGDGEGRRCGRRRSG